jgi:electron-transferring-flavoprotein dehydrogenase
MNVLKVKGTHNAIKSGFEAAKAIFEKLVHPEKHVSEDPRRVEQYEKNIKRSWMWKEMH